MSKKLEKLKKAMSDGEKIPPEILERLNKRFGTKMEKGETFNDMEGRLNKRFNQDGPSSEELRQPTLSERLLIKTYGETAPEKVARYIAERGIDPDFDVGVTWHDPTVDIAGDIVTGIGGGLGALAGVPFGGLLGATGGAMAGGALTKGALGALAPEEVRPELADSLKQGALEEGLGTVAFGAGRIPGIAQPIGRGIRKGIGYLEGIPRCIS